MRVNTINAIKELARYYEKELKGWEKVLQALSTTTPHAPIADVNEWKQQEALVNRYWCDKIISQLRQIIR